MVKFYVPFALAVSLFSLSCNSLFDSYYPASTELVEGQYDLQALFKTPITDVQMRALTTFDPYLAIQATAESTKIILLDTKTMTALRVLGEDDLRGLTGGYVPKLLPLVEGISGITPVISIGEVSFSSSNWSSPSFSPVPNVGGTAENSATFDGASTLVIDRQGSSASGPTLSLAGSIGTVFFPPYSNPRVLDFNGSSTLGAVVMLDDVSPAKHLLLFQLTPASFSAFSWGVTISGEVPLSGDLRSAFVTKTAAVLLVHPQNGGQTTFRAFAWDGTAKATLPLMGEGGITPPVCFDKEGIYWYLYDSHNGRIQQFRTWW